MMRRPHSASDPSALHRTSPRGDSVLCLPGLRERLAQRADLTASDLAEMLCADQVRSWQAGLRIPAEAYLALLADRPDAAEPHGFEIIYGEFILREALGEAPAEDEFAWRFPHLADRLRRQFELHRALAAEEPTGDAPPLDDEPDLDREPELPGGPRIPGYRVLAELGRGGMGVVYRALHERLNRLVALKVISASSYAVAETAARFRAEAEASASLQHPNIVHVYEVGEADGQGYLALEYADGGSLAAKLAGTPQIPLAAAAALETLARAVAYAHARGVVHRDLKPANVVLTADGVPKLTDFGLARLIEADSASTLSGMVAGTPSYMAPEQARGGPGATSPAVDVYALGAILYEMLTGRPPFKGATQLSTLEQVATQEPLPPGQFQRNLPRDLEAICLKCLQKEPRRRYADADELADDLRRSLQGRPVLARPTSPVEAACKWARRKPAAATAIASVFTATLLMLFGSLYYSTRLRAAAEAADRKAHEAREQRNLALKAVNQLIFDVQERLDEAPATGPLRRSLLDTAISGLDEIARGADASAPDLSRAVAHQKLGEIFRQVGRVDDARRQLDVARRLATALAAAAPGEPAIAECLGGAYLGLGQIHLSTGRNDEAKAEFQHVVAIAERIAAADPRDMRARGHLLEAYFQLGRAYSFSGELATGGSWFRKMHDLAARWAGEEPGEPRARDLLAVSLRKLGDTHKLMREDDDARLDYLRAIALGRELVAAQPKNRRFRHDLAKAVDDLADVAGRQRRSDEARSLYREAEELFEGMLSADPDDLETRLGLIFARRDLARIERDGGDYPTAATLLRQVLDDVRQLRDERRIEDSTTLSPDRTEALDRELRDCLDAPDALGDLATVTSQPTDKASRMLLVRTRLLAARGDVAGALDAASALCELRADSAEDLATLARGLAAGVACLDGLPGSAGPARARLADRAVAHLQAAAACGFSDVRRLEIDPAFRSLAGLRAYRDLLQSLGAPSKGVDLRR